RFLGRIAPPDNKPNQAGCDPPVIPVSIRPRVANVRSRRNIFPAKKNAGQAAQALARRPDFSRDYLAKAILRREGPASAAMRKLPSLRSAECKSRRSQS